MTSPSPALFSSRHSQPNPSTPLEPHSDSPRDAPAAGPFLPPSPRQPILHRPEPTVVLVPLLAPSRARGSILRLPGRPHQEPSGARPGERVRVFPAARAAGLSGRLPRVRARARSRARRGGRSEGAPAARESRRRYAAAAQATRPCRYVSPPKPSDVDPTHLTVFPERSGKAGPSGTRGWGQLVPRDGAVVHPVRGELDGEQRERARARRVREHRDDAAEGPGGFSSLGRDRQRSRRVWD